MANGLIGHEGHRHELCPGPAHRGGSLPLYVCLLACLSVCPLAFDLWFMPCTWPVTGSHYLSVSHAEATSTDVAMDCASISVHACVSSVPTQIS